MIKIIHLIDYNVSLSIFIRVIQCVQSRLNYNFIGLFELVFNRDSESA